MGLFVASRNVGFRSPAKVGSYVKLKIWALEGGTSAHKKRCGIAGFSCIPRVEEIFFNPGDKKPVLSF